MNRLDLISSLCRGSKTVLDVGCDHAYALINSIKNYGVVNGIASDINEGPLNNAKNNIIKEGLESKIKTQLSDGLKDINDSFDTLIISGMGGILIEKILSDSISKINNKKIIIEANSDSYLVRKYLCKNGYIITDEYSLFDDGKYYEIIVFEEGNYNYASFALKYGPILLEKKEDAFISHYKFLLKQLEEFLPSIKDTIKKDEKLVLRNDYNKIIYGNNTKMIPILDTDNYYREYFIDDNKRPLIVIAPGGGYKYTSPRESEPIAEYYNKAGFHAVIVNYRESMDKFPYPMKCIASVINNYDNDERVSKIVGIGFSAGGHCMLDVALHQKEYNTHIDLLILAYPVVTNDPSYWHKGSFENLLLDDFNNEELLRRTSLEKEVRSDAPDLFLWGTSTDESVPVMNSIKLLEAYSKLGLNIEYHLYPCGGHGLSLANSQSSCGDKNKELPYISNWIDHSIEWLKMKI